MSQPIRSFVAFDITNNEIVQGIFETQEKLLRTGADLKLVKPQNVHITIRFLGNIQLAIVERIHTEMERAFTAPFEVELEGVGVFPSLKYARVVWIGIRKGTEQLKEVSDRLESRIRELKVKPDLKGFNPHITIARVRTGRNRAELVRLVGELQRYDFGVLRADCLKLKKSVLTPKGPIYSTLKEVCR